MRRTKVAAHTIEFLLCFRWCVGCSKYLMSPFTAATHRPFPSSYCTPGRFPGTGHGAVTKTWRCPHRACGLAEETGARSVRRQGVLGKHWGLGGAGEGEGWPFTLTAAWDIVKFSSPFPKKGAGAQRVTQGLRPGPGGLSPTPSITACPGPSGGPGFPPPPASWYHVPNIPNS